ncbi:hypothetical protein SCHPADRAFT_634838 [Schizopora paradoxa]|uniref:DUF6533 domain-containing protein n=1 Tax=Schizopora paradoxa TaxID=27342 RepID=A0A0H2R7F7_9AGAM|nr:hypothetical protein SCHPADRAFT_634838 [Schizopora paradoxa]
MTTPTPSQALEALNVNYVNLSAFTLLAYDSILNIDHEVNYIWSQRWSFVSFIYIASKYLAFVDGALTIDLLLRPERSPDECLTVFRLMTYFVLSGMVLAEIILLLRTWAIWGLSRYILAYLIVIDVAVAIVSFSRLHRSQKELFFSSSSPIPVIRPCFPIFMNQGNNIYIDYVCVMMAEGNALGLTLWKGLVQWRGNRNTLFDVFIKDGVLYFICLFVVSGINVIFYTTQNRTMYWMLLTEPQRILHAVLAARLVINMRLYADRLKRQRSEKPESDTLPLSVAHMTLDTRQLTGNFTMDVFRREEQSPLEDI